MYSSGSINVRGNRVALSEAPDRDARFPCASMLLGPRCVHSILTIYLQTSLIYVGLATLSMSFSSRCLPEALSGCC